MWHLHTKKVDRERIGAAFAGRQFLLPAVIDAGADVRASIFFPPAASPKALSVLYVSEQGEGRVKIDLAEVLRGLHLSDSQKE